MLNFIFKWSHMVSPLIIGVYFTELYLLQVFFDLKIAYTNLSLKAISYKYKLNLWVQGNKLSIL